MRTLLPLVVGIVLGATLTFGTVELSGGWYAYRTIPDLGMGRCIEPLPSGAEIVPHQPNPCHYRTRRWLPSR